MTQNEELIETFYSAFANGDAEGMRSCYHPDVEFEDPAFGILKGKDAADMWEMLIERSNGNLKIEFFDIKAGKDSGSAKWIATYIFSKTQRNVVNEVTARFQFKDNLIIRHTDHFNFWNWCKQAMGLTGWLLGWTGFMQNKIQATAILSLRKYQEKKRK